MGGGGEKYSQSLPAVEQEIMPWPDGLSTTSYADLNPSSDWEVDFDTRLLDYNSIPRLSQSLFPLD